MKHCNVSAETFHEAFHAILHEALKHCTAMFHGAVQCCTETFHETGNVNLQYCMRHSMRR